MFVIYLCRFYILTAAAQFLIFEQKPEKADVIVVLSGDENGERESYGARLFKDGYARNIMVSGGLVVWNVTYASAMRGHLINLGVEPSAILIEDKSTSTYENSLFSKDIILKKGFKSILLVTSPFHSRRAYWVFDKMFSKEGVKVISCPVPGGFSLAERWWNKPREAEFKAYEYERLIWYKLKGRI
jgi:uncharacterized SAM-binding protein YcdF (DUF218 family)